jgi:hypothetical protein
VNIKTFLTHIPFGSEEYYSYDLREPKRKIINPDKIRETKKTVISTTDWSNIPHYPTTREKRENVAKYLVKMGRQIPPELLKQIQEDKRKEIEEDSFNNFSNTTKQDYDDDNDNDDSQSLPEENLLGFYNYHQQHQQQQHQQQQHQHQQQQQHQQQFRPPHPPLYQNFVQNGHISKIPIHVQKPPPNKYSQQYAAYVGAKPRAQASARVKLGGVF